MSQETTYVGKAGEWRGLLASVGANVAELAHLEVPRTRLEALQGRAEDLFRQQAALAASKQEISRQLRAVFNEGERLATVLRKSLQAQYGPQAEKLTEFGVKPFRGRKRKQAGATEPAPEPAPGIPAASNT